MVEILKNIFSPDGFIPHGHCLLWRSSAVWLHVVSDSLITLAYYSIPIILLYFVRRRRDLAFPWMFLMFGAFIFGCGTTHLMGVWTLWVPTYWLDGVIKAVTAFFSLATAVLLVQLVPKALALRSPAELEAVNQELERQITDRRRVEEYLQKARDELETRVQERTVELSKSNELLKNEITERKTAGEKIREQAELLNKAQDAIIVRDLEDHILFCNEGTLRLYGLDGVVDEPGGLNGKKINELLYKQDSSQFEEAKRITLEKGEWNGELFQTTKDGKEVIVESHWSLIRDNRAKPTSILSINTDATEKKKLEAQFLRAQRIASIGTLAGGIAHDLNNVLHPIIIALQLLQERFTDEKSQSWLDTLETSAHRGANLVKQVLSFARRLEGQYIILQIRHIIVEIEKILGETFPKSIEIHTDIPKDLCMFTKHE